MKKLRMRFTPEAARSLLKLHPENRKLIRAALNDLRQNTYSGDDLQEELSGFKSYKSKRYRILYKINEEEKLIEIYYIGHRRDVYDQFRLLLNKLQKSSRQ
jgi:mRNA-degrading endonuclease RelE of RelBE toxin-antitoxin system